MKPSIEVGTESPEMNGYCSALQQVIEQWSELMPAQIIAGLEMVKLQYQLELFGVLGQSENSDG